MVSGGSGTSRLAQVIARRIADQTQRPDALELGTIQDDMSLKLDRFAIPMPTGEYLVAEWKAKITLPSFSLVGSETCMDSDDLVTTSTSVYDDGSPMPGASGKGLASYSFKPVEISEASIEIKPELKSGDRVLVAWVNDGIHPIILSKVVSS